VLPIRKLVGVVAPARGQVVVGEAEAQAQAQGLLKADPVAVVLMESWSSSSIRATGGLSTLKRL
jgi:hypothetical protein